MADGKEKVESPFSFEELKQLAIRELIAEHLKAKKPCTDVVSLAAPGPRWWRFTDG
jgi:hypothetical protein